MNQHLYSRLIVIISVCLAVIGIGPVAAQDGQTANSGPHVITGSYETTNPIYPTIGADTTIVLYDLTGLILRDFAFEPAEVTQILGTLDGDIVSGTYTLTLPDTPAGLVMDFDGDTATPPAVQVFAPATFIEFRGDEYMNRGEPVLDLTAQIDPMTYRIIGGHVLVWAEQAGELFPAGFGVDHNAFTDDDPLLELPAGWSVVALDSEPFTLIRDDTVDMPIIESLGALHDYSDLSYSDAWEALFARTRETYPFTAEKNIDWDQIHDTITPLVVQAESALDFHLIIAQFGSLIPDTHIGYASIPVLQNYMMGGFGVSMLAVTDADEVVVTSINPASAAEKAGMQAGDVLLEVGGIDALEFLDETPLLLSSASTEHGRRYLQAATMLQGPVGTQVEMSWYSQATGQIETELFTRTMDISAIMAAFGGVLTDDVVSTQMLDSGLGYMRMTSFVMEVSDANAMFAAGLQELIDAGAQGIILDMRGNSGGLVGLAMSMAGQFFPEYTRLIDLYYADGEGGFAYRGSVEILVGDTYYDGPVAVLVDEMTGSAGDMFTYAMTTNDRAIIVGNTPSGGFTGEVGDGQYTLPGSLSIQIPTGRPVDPESGITLIEGVGVPQDIDVPLTIESILSPEDEVLQAAEAALLAQVN